MIFENCARTLLLPSGCVQARLQVSVSNRKSCLEGVSESQGHALASWKQATSRLTKHVSELQMPLDVNVLASWEPSRPASRCFACECRSRNCSAFDSASEARIVLCEKRGAPGLLELPERCCAELRHRRESSNFLSIAFFDEIFAHESAIGKTFPVSPCLSCVGTCSQKLSAEK